MSRVLLPVVAVLALSGCGGNEAEGERFENELARSLGRQFYPTVAGVPLAAIELIGATCASSTDGTYECVVKWASDLKSDSTKVVVRCDDRSCVGEWAGGRAITLDVPD